jgi:hypothetical protein
MIATAFPLIAARAVTHVTYDSLKTYYLRRCNLARN